MRTRPSTLLGSLSLILLLTGCGDSAATGQSGTAGGSGSSESGASDESGSSSSDTGDGDGDSATGDGDGDGDGDGNPSCGNGVVEGDEQCDDGDENGELFACLADCTPNICGDGLVGPEEGCDDGNTLPDDGCSASCLIEDPGEATLCGNKIYACGDTIDNDMDGLIDLNDPECISPCDDDEGSFETDLPGQNLDCKSDCYFDANSGGGDDKCEWNLKCDPENPGAEIGCAYDPDFMMCDFQQPQDCVDFCGPLVPNGCDCFGCCEIEGQFIYLNGANCSLDNLDACQSCTFFDGCNNPCDAENCELCFGQNPDDLPDNCQEPSCPDSETSCLSIDDCAEGEFCQTGCCSPIVPQ